jgi:hypothetical protein
MKPFLLFLFLLFITIQLSAQELINLNPDPAGEPWYVGKLRQLTAEDYKKIEQTPKLKMTTEHSKGSLPASIDNSLNKYFRPVFNQHNGSCGQASGIGYNYTYAINFARDLSANTLQTQYPTHYTYNFLNDGADNGSFYFDGWEIINANGCPNVETYGGTPWAKGLQGWMSGYDNYYSGMKNRVLETFTVDLSTPTGLETLKAWMNDQLDGSSVGGLANFSAGVSGTFSMTTLAAGTPEGNKSVITHWDSEINHAMTFVGYNDSIRYDFNGDGKYTNNKDINGDSEIDMRDWEKGGLIMVNSWGDSWGNAGKAFVPYKLLAEASTNGGIGSELVYVIRAKATYDPKITLKASITYNSRNKLRITAGASSDPNATRPDRILQLPLFNFQGGDVFMQGGTLESDKTIEIGLDITPLLSEINSGAEARIFLVVDENDPSGSSYGTINSFSVLDYTNGGLETVCPQNNVVIKNNDTTFLAVNKTLTFEKVKISTSSLPDVISGFPYTYPLEAESGTPPYTWDFAIDYKEENSSSGYVPLTNIKLLPGSYDDGISDLTLPFPFPFYDKTYSDVKVSSDGSILFGDNFEYVRDISALISVKAITVYGTDLMLYPREGDGIWYFSSRDSLTVRWKTSKYDNASFNTDFSVTLFPSGKISFSYGSGITSSADWVSGISNGDGISYNIASISGENTILPGHQIIFTPQGFPDGMGIDKNGIITVTTRQGNKDWSVTAKVTDLNKISSKKTFSIHSIESLKFTPDTLKFDNSINPDPWQTGKDLTISNVCNRAVTINNLDMEGPGWKVSDSPLSYPYILQPGESLSLNVRLKSSFAKSTGMIWDTMSVQTNYVVYPLPVTIDPAIFSTSVYAVTFNIGDNDGPVTGAVITVDKLTGTISTNNAGTASVLLPNGKYNYYISFKNHTPLSGIIEVNSATKTIDLFIGTVGIESDPRTTVTVFPNPFSDELIIKGISEKTKITVTGIQANVLILKQASGTEEVIDTRTLPCGIYIITIESSNGGKIVKKVIKKK